MSFGCVYAMTNPGMPGLVKIGRTIDPEFRALQLSRLTAVPASFDLVYASDILDDAALVEAMVHSALRKRRFRQNREFFRVSPEEAAMAIQSAALMNAWNRAGKEARDEFMARILAEAA